VRGCVHLLTVSVAGMAKYGCVFRLRPRCVTYLPAHRGSQA
jgi:hypothetical protein